jgi:hypothetical protein
MCICLLCVCCVSLARHIVPFDTMLDFEFPTFHKTTFKVLKELEIYSQRNYQIKQHTDAAQRKECKKQINIERRNSMRNLHLHHDAENERIAKHEDAAVAVADTSKETIQEQEIVHDTVTIEEENELEEEDVDHDQAQVTVTA